MSFVVYVGRVLNLFIYLFIYLFISEHPVNNFVTIFIMVCLAIV